MKKGYRLYDRETSQVLFSRNVKFNEQEYELTETGGESTRVCCMELDLDKGSESGQEDICQREKADWVERANLTIHHEPTSYQEARSSPERDQWNQAMDREMESLKTNKVWKPPDKKAFGSNWVYWWRWNS